MSLDPNTLEYTGLDRLALTLERIGDKLSRSITISDLDAPPAGGLSLPAGVDRAGKFIRFDDSGNVGLSDVGGGSVGDVTADDVTWSSDLSPVPGAAGNPGIVPLPAYMRGEIILDAAYPGLTFGIGVSASARAINTAILAQAMADSGTLRRPLRGRAGAVLEIDYIHHTTSQTEFNLNGMRLRHGASTATTMLFVSGQSSASRIANFKLYNGVLDGNAQAKSGNYYVFSAMFHSGMVLEDLTFLDFWSNAWIVSDPYVAGSAYPSMTSDGLRMKRIRNVRSAANIAHIASNPSMMQGDQGVVTHVYDAKLEDIFCYYSGRSGLSFSLCDGGLLRDFRSSSCWSPLYLETLSNTRIDGFDIRDHMHFDGVTQAIPSQAIWVVDGDQSLPGSGFATAKNLSITNGLISSFSRVGGGSWRGIRISGRDGPNHARNINISNISGQGCRDSGAQAYLLSFEGQITGLSASNITAHDMDCGVVGDLPYSAPGGSPVNRQTDCWVRGLSASSVTYPVYWLSAGGQHVRSGVRDSTFGGAAGYAASTISLINNVV